MKTLSGRALRRLYFLAALLLPLSAIIVAVVIDHVPQTERDKYSLLYEIAVNVAASGLAVLVTLVCLDKAEAVRMTDTIADAIRDPHLPLSGTLRRLLRDALSNTDRQNNIEIFRDHSHAYDALVDDIEEGDVFMINTIFVTDERRGKYDPAHPSRKKWVDTIKHRLERASPLGHGDALTLYLLEAPKGGAADFVQAIGGLEKLKATGGRLSSLNLSSEHSEFMANFVLIKKTDQNVTHYIVYLGWFARAPGSSDYPNPCARIQSEHLYKFLQNSYCRALTAAAITED